MYTKIYAISATELQYSLQTLAAIKNAVQQDLPKVHTLRIARKIIFRVTYR